MLQRMRRAASCARLIEEPSRTDAGAVARRSSRRRSGEAVANAVRLVEGLAAASPSRGEARRRALDDLRAYDAQLIAAANARCDAQHAAGARRRGGGGTGAVPCPYAAQRPTNSHARRA
jgi:hypothetical protein